MIYRCNFDNCPLMFNRPWKLKRHEELHMGIKSYVCSEKNCSKSYSTSSHLKRHIEISHRCETKSVVSYLCSFPTCNANFQTASGLQKHEKKHLYGHQCSICNRFFLDRSVYHRHTLRHRKKPKTSTTFNKLTSTTDNSKMNGLYLCEECCTSFVDEKAFISHCKSSHEPGTSTFYCGESNCQKSFKFRRNLNEHIRCCHSEASVFICGELGCTKVFRYKRNMKKHILTKHLKVSLRCPVESCNRSFLFKTSLKFHIRQHQLNLVVEKKKKIKYYVDLAKQITDSIVSNVA